MHGRHLGAVAATCAAAAVLVPGTGDRVARLLAPGPATSVETAVLDLVAVVGTLVVGHLAVVSALVVVLGRVAPRSRAFVLALRLTPARWRRVVLAAAGAAVVLAAQAPSAGQPTQSTDVRPPPLGGLRLPDRPDSPESARPPAAAPAEPTRPATGARPVVVVRVGDSLWRVAERALPASASTADVARAVRRWYRANRSVVGPDPDLVHPGARLVHPQQENRP